MVEHDSDICNELKTLDNLIILFSSDFELPNNEETMNYFLEFFDIPEENILIHDGTYCEIKFNSSNYEVHASGNGDFKNHKIEIKKIT